MLTAMADAFAGFRLAEVEGIPVLWKRDRRFKTFRFSLIARRPLDERAAARSLLPSMLLQGTERDPDRPALARRMEMLYGAAVLPSTSKIGESHLLRFSLDSVAGSHVPGEPDLLSDGLDFLGDILARPRLENGEFATGVFRREQVQAAHEVRALFNDKMVYAGQQALSQACAGEPMAIPEHGGVAAIEALQPADPERARADFLQHGQMWGVAMGALPEEGSLERIGAFLTALPARSPEPVGDPVQVEPRPARADVERANVQQAKQVLVYRVPWTNESRTWVARALFASMLGGGPHSRLFREVREKQSLAYYAHAAVDRNKGLLQVHVGLDESAAERVQVETQKQIEELAAGRFEPAELETARAGLLSTLAAIDDSIGDRMEFTSRQWLLQQDRTPEQQAELYASIQQDEVASSMDGVWLDYSYLLAPQATEAKT